MDNNISFSKIVSTPTLNSWSQAYNAGKLFAVISLEKRENLPEDSEPLNSLGKNLLGKLEQEFFTIEEKNLDSIKKAISATFEGTPEEIELSFAACVFINDVLYLFAIGFGKAFLKREDNLGLILGEGQDPNEIISSSGFLKENDLIVLATEAFSKEITNEELNSNLTNDTPSEIAESMAPKIHKAENGKISAIIIKYENLKTDTLVAQNEPSMPLQTKENEAIGVQPKPISPFEKYLSLLQAKSKNILKKPNIKILPSKKLFLGVAIIGILIVLVLSVYFSIQQQNDAKAHALFNEIYPQAEKKFEEGQSLLILNKNLARDSFLSAQKILDNNKDQFTQNSKESTQVQELLKKVEDELNKISPKDPSGLDRSTLIVEVQNGSGVEGVAGKAADVLKEFGYTIASTANADNYDYEGVTIKIKEDKKAFIELLKKDLSKDYKVSNSSSDLPSDSSTDVLVIIGK